MNVRSPKYRTAAALALVGALGLTACGNSTSGLNGSDNGSSDSSGGSTASGTLAGAGASSTQSAQDAWMANFISSNPDVTVTYDPVGSGGGRDQFLAGSVDFAGSDAYLGDDEVTKSKEQACTAGQAVDLPLYISPIAVVFNLDGIESLNMSAETIAKIFSGQITNWNDPAIAAENPDAKLPDLAITAVHRSDDSGTTENFTDYLNKAGNGAWKDEAAGTWPTDGGQSGKGTSGLISVVEGAQGTIGYADSSKAGDLGTAKIKVGDDYVEHSAEGAAKAVEVSPRVEGRSDSDIAVELDRTTSEAGAYPLVLVSYLIVCDAYPSDQADKAANVKAYASYITSPEGQKIAAEAAGSAPLSDALSADVKKVVDGIAAQ